MRAFKKRYLVLWTRKFDLDPVSGKASDLSQDRKDGLPGEGCPKQREQPMQRCHAGRGMVCPSVPGLQGASDRLALHPEDKGKGFPCLQTFSSFSLTTTCWSYAVISLICALWT